MSDARRDSGSGPSIERTAPGRVNLIGEHTDYNGGFVLPMTLPHETRARVTPRGDRVVQATSAEAEHPSELSYELGAETRQKSWIDYVQGLTWALGERRIQIGGFDLAISSTVPVGKGLSSSAALEVSTLRALSAAFNLALSGSDIAFIAHRAETEFVGAPVGIMDQMVCSLGEPSTALFIDARSAAYERIPFPTDLELGVIDSGISHAHASGDYRTRRQECTRAAALLGIESLRDVTPDDVKRIEALPSPLDRRVRHVVTENRRVLDALEALRHDRPAELGRLFLESHASMRDDFEVSLPEIDRLVALAADHPDAYGARLTGGGFGGAVIILCRASSARAVTRATLARYRASTDLPGEVLLPIYGHSA